MNYYAEYKKKTATENKTPQHNNTYNSNKPR
jgi:hypothetical protein